MQANAIQKVIDQVNCIVLGKDQTVRLAVACLMARGHLLIEDLPGMGKTTLAHALASALGLNFQRIQFTSDLLPADIIGVTVYDNKAGSFNFRPGPIFSQVVLADEINRATPRAQGALLEAMEEHQVTVDGETHPLPRPFFVLATQNPNTHAGTFPLPEAQMDRFLMRVSLGYPDPAAEREIVRGKDRRSLLEELKPIMSLQEVLKLQLEVPQVFMSDAVLDYVQRLVHYTRTSARLNYGLSPRGTLGLVRSAQAWAFIHQREHVLPEDVQAVLASVIEHRLRSDSSRPGQESVSITQRLLKEVDVVG